jgi:CheY-like chemotaxis protein
LDEGTKITVTFFLKLRQTEEIHYEDFVNLPVLVADDDELSVESACSMLETLGMKPEGVFTGSDAVKMVREHHKNDSDYFAVILDWKMPGMDGLDTAREIRKAVGEDITIIIISAYDWSDIEQEARQAGVNMFISKPLFKSRLAHLFNKLVGQEEEILSSEPINKLEEMDLLGYRALLVEDNDLNAEIAEVILKSTGMEIDRAENGAVAVDMVCEHANHVYDIIFMDIKMPKMNGYDATRVIRNIGGEYYKNVPIIAMTANAFAEDVQAAISAGMNEHMAKPIDLESLARVLHKWIISKETPVK